MFYYSIPSFPDYEGIDLMDIDVSPMLTKIFVAQVGRSYQQGLASSHAGWSVRMVVCQVAGRVQLTGLLLRN